MWVNVDIHVRLRSVQMNGTELKMTSFVLVGERLSSKRRYSKRYRTSQSCGSTIAYMDQEVLKRVFFIYTIVSRVPVVLNHLSIGVLNTVEDFKHPKLSAAHH